MPNLALPEKFGLELAAMNDSDILSVTGSVGLSLGGESFLGAAGTVSLNFIVNTVEVSISNSSNTADSAGNILLLAKDDQMP